MKIHSQTFFIISVAALAITLILSNSHAVYAMQSLGEDTSINRVGPQHYGITTKNTVCGDKLCNQAPIDHISKLIPNKIKSFLNDPNHNPSVKTEQIFHYSKQDQNGYTAVLKLSGGNVDLRNVQLLVGSDMEQKNIPIDGLFSKSSQAIQVRIHAQDPKSIISDIGSWEYNE